MTLVALNGTWCPNNSEVMLNRPDTVAFECTYEIELVGSNTTFTWWLNGMLLAGYTEKVAHIAIPSGQSIVTCMGFIDASAISINCSCTEMRSLSVTVVGTSSCKERT